MNLTNVFKDFCTKLNKRKGFLSEDNIRFYWFASMLKYDSNLNNYSLEEPYPKSKEELDLKYENNSEIFVFEIKFHRYQIKNGKGLPKTESAGKIFNDLIRLPSWTVETRKPIHYFFLYVTDNVMNEYLSGSKLLKTFFNSEVGISFTGRFICENCAGGNTSKSFFRSACRSLGGKLCSTYSSKTKVCFTTCKGKEGPILTHNITLIDKNDALHCGAYTLKTPECWVRLYEIK